MCPFYRSLYVPSAIIITFFVLFSLLSYVYFTRNKGKEFSINGYGKRKMGKYNVLLITVDDLRPDMTCFGESDVMVHSPSIDRLASKSLVLRQAFCQYPLCGPVGCLSSLDADQTQPGYISTVRHFAEQITSPTCFSTSNDTDITHTP